MDDYKREVIVDEFLEALIAFFKLSVTDRDKAQDHNDFRIETEADRDFCEMQAEDFEKDRNEWKVRALKAEVERAKWKVRALEAEVETDFWKGAAIEETGS